ncbi:hypothetical protein BH23PLA1_BH23PLA1_06770 [soil metagenome]
MIEPHFTPLPGFRRPRGLIGMLILLLVVEVVIGRFDRYLEGPISYEWRFADRAARSEAHDCEVLCFGDSLIKNGILPRAFEASTGLRGYNLAVGGGQAPANYYLLKHALDSGARPSAIVTNFSPGLLQLGPGHNRDHWASLTDPFEGIELARMARDPDLLASMTLIHALPSVRYRPAIRDRLGKQFGRPSVLDWRMNHVIGRTMRVNRGPLVMPSQPFAFPDPEGYTRSYFPPDWHPHPLNELYVHRFLDLAESYSIPVFWLIPPCHPEIHLRIEHSEYVIRFGDYLDRILAQYPRLIVVDGSRSKYDSSLFWDPQHLGRSGAAILSEDLAFILDQSLKSEGMEHNGDLELPDAEIRPIAVVIEDVVESRAEVRNAWLRRRQ